MNRPISIVAGFFMRGRMGGMALRRAGFDDFPLLVAYMRQFYAESGYELNESAAELSFAKVISDERLGSVWLFIEDNQSVGYLVLALKFSMEFGGLVACVEDMFIVTQFRNRGIGTKALVEVRQFCSAHDILALTVEVGFGNAAAQAAYSRAGFVKTQDRELLVATLG